MAYKKIGVTIALDGEKEFRAAVSAINASYKTMKSNVALVDSAFKGQRNTVAALVSRQNALGHSIDTLRQKNALYKAAVQNAQEQEAKASERKAKLLQQYNQESQKLEMLKKLYGENSPAVKNQAEKVEELRKELQQADKGMMSTAKSTAYWTDKLNKGEIELHDLEEEVEKTDKYLKEAQSSFKGTAKSIDEFGNEISEAKGASSGFGNYLKANLLSSAITMSVSKMRYGFVEMAKSAVTAGANFEFAMSRVEALSGATDFQVQQLANKARTLGETTIYTAEQVADGLGKMALAGWTAQEMLEGIDGVVLMAASSEMELDAATSALADTLKAFGDTASQSGRYADVFARTQASTNTTTAQLSAALSRCATTAGTFNYSIEDVSAALGIMANSGYKGARAGTALNTIMTRLASNTSGCADKLEALGVDVINDATGNMNDLGYVVMQLADAMSTMSDSEAAALAKLIGGQRGVAALNALVVQGSEAYYNLNEQLVNAAGSAKAMSSIMLDNLYGDTVILKSATESLGITFEKAFDPAFRNSVQKTTNFIAELNDEIRSGTGVGAAVNDMALAFEDASEDVVKFGLDLTEGAIKSISWIINNRKPLVSALKVVGSAVLAYKGIQVIDNVATATSTLVTKANALARRMLTRAVFENAAATEVEIIAESADITTKELLIAATATLSAETKALLLSMAAEAAVVGAVTAGALLLCKYYDQVDEATEELVNSSERLTTQMQDQVDASNNLVTNISDTTSNLDAQAETAATLVDELFELQDSTEDASVKQALMQEKVDQLNALYPGLNASIDKNTGSLNMSAAAMKNQISQMQKASKVSAYSAAMTDLNTQIVNNRVAVVQAEAKLKELNATIEEEASKAEEGANNTKTYSNAYWEAVGAADELEAQIAELNGQNEVLGEQLAVITDDCEGYANELGLTVDEVNEMKNATDDLAGATSDMAGEVETAAGALATAVGDAATKAVSSFDKISESTKYEADDLEAALEYNTQVVTNWGNNMQTLIAWGIDEGLLQQLAEAGPESASLAQAIVDMGDIKAREYSQKWVENVNAADAIADDLQAAVDRGKVIAEIGADDIAVTFADGQVSVIRSSKSVIEAATTDMVSGATSVANSKWSTLKTITNTHFAAVPPSISKNKAKALKAADDLSRGVTGAASSLLTVSAGSSIGMNIPLGAAQGISSYAYRAANEAAAMARQIIRAARSALGVNSPSKEFRAIGEFTGQGFILGYQDSMKNVNGIINDSMQFSVSPTLRGMNGSTDAVSMIQQLGVNLVRSVENMNNGLAENIVNAFVDAGIGIEVDGYNFGKLVRKEVAMA